MSSNKNLGAFRRSTSVRPFFSQVLLRGSGHATVSCQTISKRAAGFSGGSAVNIAIQELLGTQQDIRSAARSAASALIARSAGLADRAGFVETALEPALGGDKAKLRQHLRQHLRQRQPFQATATSMTTVPSNSHMLPACHLPTCHLAADCFFTPLLPRFHVHVTCPAASRALFLCVTKLKMFSRSQQSRTTWTKRANSSLPVRTHDARCQIALACVRHRKTHLNKSARVRCGLLARFRHWLKRPAWDLPSAQSTAIRKSDSGSVL